MRRDFKQGILVLLLCFVFSFVFGNETRAAKLGIGSDVQYLPNEFVEEENPEDDITLEDDVEFRVLFVGNSLSGKNQMGEIFEKMALAGGHKIQVETLWKNGCSLSHYANRNHPMGKRLRILLKKGKWDYVVLQDRTVRPITEPKESQQAVKKLRNLIKNNGAKMMFLETWAPEKKYKIYDKPAFRKMSVRKFQQEVRDFYKALGRKYNAKVILAGDAFERARNMKGINLFMPDGKHPSLEGSYLAASVCYATFFNEKVPGWSGTLNAEKAVKLQRVANQIVF